MRLFRCIDLLAFDRSPWCELVAFTMSAWNKEQTLKFLLFLRETPPLWDVKHRDHRNRLVIQDSYQKIVDLLRPDIADVSVDAIKKKFRTITNQVIAADARRSPAISSVQLRSRKLRIHCCRMRGRISFN